MFRLLILVLLLSPLSGKTQNFKVDLSRWQMDSLNKVVTNHIELGKFYLALQLNERLDSMISNHLDTLSESYGLYCLNKGRINAFYNKTKDAEDNYLNAKHIYNKQGNSNPTYFKTLNYLALFYRGIGAYKSSEKTYDELKKLLAKAYAKIDSQYINCLNEMGLLYKDMQQYKKAESYLIEAQKLQLASLSQDHPNLANTLNNLGILYKNMGRYEEAIHCYNEVLRIREIHLGKLHILYTSSLTNLANLYLDLANYPLAEYCFLELIRLRGKAYGPNHPYYATSLEGLAQLYKAMGIYKKAIAYSIEANKIRESSLGSYHIVYAGGLSNLAQTYTEAGMYDEALLLYPRALSIYKATLGKDHLKYLDCLNRIAILYTYRGNYSKARSYFEEVLTSRESHFGRQNTQYAEGLANLAFLYNEMGLCDSSEFNLQESLKILQSVLGSKHYKCAQIMDKLAVLYKDLGKIQQADLMFRKTKIIRENMLGKKHFLYATSLSHLADVCELQKKYTESDKLLEELNELDQNRMRNAVSFLSEIELANYILSFQLRTNELGAYINSRPLNNIEKLTSLILDNAIFSKGFLLMAASQLNNTASDIPEFELYRDHLRAFRKQLAVEYAKPKSEQRNVADLETKANSIEKKLRRLNINYLQYVQQVKWQKIRDRLKTSEATIEFIPFQIQNQDKQVTVMYAAIVLRSDSKVPRFISLCKETDLDSLIKSKYKLRQDYINAMYNLYNRGVVEPKILNKSLYELVWKPIEPELNGVKTIYYSPGGLFHRINLSAVRSSKNTTLADQFQLIELNSTRQLTLPNHFNNTTNDAILYGGIYYSVSDTAAFTDATQNQQENLKDVSVDSTRGRSSWPFLEGTEREVRALNDILTNAGFNVTLKMGYDATEESFKALGSSNETSPRIINIATHGFFFPDKVMQSKYTSQLLDESMDEPEFVISEQPMMRSGLILSNGNDTWQGKNIPTGKDDGILTAYEISQMNLSNTELVVLSACETGLGDIQGNEGVYGLQRAFKIAGVKYIIMSLWQVPDLETSEFMISFYKNWLEVDPTSKQSINRSIPEAFRLAQKAMKDRFISPYQWAGFVLVE